MLPIRYTDEIKKFILSNWGHFCMAFYKHPKELMLSIVHLYQDTSVALK